MVNHIPARLKFQMRMGWAFAYRPGGILFQYRYSWNGKPQRLSLGRYPALTLKDARNLISDLRVMYDSGTDPRRYTEKTTGEHSMTVGDCLTYWKEQYVDVALRPRTQMLYTSTVLKHLSGAFPGRAIGDITLRQWIDFFSREERVNPRRAHIIQRSGKTVIFLRIQMALRRRYSRFQCLEFLPGIG